MPDEAHEAIQNDPDRRILTIMTMRAFQRTKAEYQRYQKDQRKNKPPLERTPMMERVIEIDFESAKKALGANPGDES